MKYLKKLQNRAEKGTLRSLDLFNQGLDFCSNDYLGLSKEKKEKKGSFSGSTGSRLISGNSSEALKSELLLSDFFQAEAALIFNSGYDANLGLLSSIPQRGEIILYDELLHASARDGIRLSHAKSFSFKHNDLVDLEKKMKKYVCPVFVVVESLYSMDGDFSPLVEINNICIKYKAKLIVDEAHTGGIFGNEGRGISVELGIEKDVFARVFTFGKAYGIHGACVVGSKTLIHYLINFARSFIYTTALPKQQYFDISSTVTHKKIPSLAVKLFENIAFFRNELQNFNLSSHEKSPIQILFVGNIEKTLFVAKQLQNDNFLVKAILSPTVPEGTERLRFCLHAFNSKDEIKRLTEKINLYT
jgi:8-amino-7-oxononanoate synthase